MILLDMTPKAEETKAKINKLYYLKVKSFCTAKEIVNKMKRQLTEWEKIVSNHTHDKKLIPKIRNKNPKQLNNNNNKI